MEKFKEYNNGLKLVVKQMPQVGSVAMGIIVGVGSCLETPETNGYSHMVEHMLFKGTSTRSARQISEKLDELGGNFNAFTGKESTCFYGKVLQDKVEDAAELLSDIFFNATFNKEELDRERKVITEEIFMDEDMPEDVCHDLVAAAFYGNQTLGYKVIGTAKNVETAQNSDLLNFKRKYYVSNNTCISFAGSIDFETAEKIVKKYFLDNFGDDRLDFKVADIKRFAPISRFDYKFKDVEQAHVAIAFESLSTGDDRLIPFKVGNIALGGGMSSRLFLSIREQNGLAYSVYSSLLSYVNNGYLELYLGTSPKNVKKAVDLLMEDIDTFVKHGFEGAEIERAKTQLKTSLVFGCENPLTLMISYGMRYLYFNESFAVDEYIASVDNVTADAATEAFSNSFDFSRCSAVYVGKECNNFNEPERFLKNKS